ncbi:unnamed protein product, partial [Effrenium voratum]
VEARLPSGRLAAGLVARLCLVKQRLKLQHLDASVKSWHMEMEEDATYITVTFLHAVSINGFELTGLSGPDSLHASLQSASRSDVVWPHEGDEMGSWGVRV